MHAKFDLGGGCQRPGGSAWGEICAHVMSTEISPAWSFLSISSSATKASTTCREATSRRPPLLSYRAYLNQTLITSTLDRDALRSRQIPQVDLLHLKPAISWWFEKRSAKDHNKLAGNILKTSQSICEKPKSEWCCESGKSSNTNNSMSRGREVGRSEHNHSSGPQLCGCRRQSHIRLQYEYYIDLDSRCVNRSQYFPWGTVPSSFPFLAAEVE